VTQDFYIDGYDDPAPYGPPVSDLELRLEELREKRDEALCRMEKERAMQYHHALQETMQLLRREQMMQPMRPLIIHGSDLVI
jgi:hypothetical protein